MQTTAVSDALMESFVIEGGHRLSGTVRAAGNKNGALPILAACLLTDGPVTLANVPAHPRRRHDGRAARRRRRRGGVDRAERGARRAAEIRKRDLDEELCRRMRASFLLAGPLLARVGGVSVPPPGGDVIGRRRLDPHIHAFAELGAEIDIGVPLRDDRAERPARQERLPRRGQRHGDGEHDHGRRARSRARR